MRGNTSVPGRVPEPRPAHVLHVVCHQPYMSSVISKRFISLGSSSDWHLPVTVLRCHAPVVTCVRTRAVRECILNPGGLGPAAGDAPACALDRGVSLSLSLRRLSPGDWQLTSLFLSLSLTPPPPPPPSPLRTAPRTPRASPTTEIGEQPSLWSGLGDAPSLAVSLPLSRSPSLSLSPACSPVSPGDATRKEEIHRLTR